MRCSSPILVLVALSIAACSKGDGRGHHASAASGQWYLRTQLAPNDSSVLGIPIVDLDSTWATGVLLSPSVLPRQAADDPDTRPTGDFGYGLGGDFNRDGKSDSAVVGVYRSRSGSKGRFALIVTRIDGRWQKVFSIGMTGPTGVTFLTRGRGDTLVWNDCVRCDASAVKIFWSGRKYSAKWEDE